MPDSSEHELASKDPSLGPEGAVPDVRIRTVVAVFHEPAPAEAAFQGLRDAGFPADDLSLVHRPQGGRPEFGVEQTHTGKTAVAGASGGAVLGGIAGLAALAIPGIGPLLAVGPIVFALTGAGIGGALGGLLGTFAGLGIPTEEARRYEDAVRRGGIFVAVRAPNARRAEEARAVLRQHGAEHVADFTAAL